MKSKSNRLFLGTPGVEILQILNKPSTNNPFLWFDCSKTIFVHKARTAIKQACRLMRLGKNAEVLAPAYNCGAEISTLLSSGASVVFYRVDKHGKIDLGDLVKYITGKSKAIYVTYYFGFPQPITEVKKICTENNLFLIEDCALSLFSDTDHNKFGSYGDLSVFNFPKSLPVPDGGALLINNPLLAKDAWALNKPDFKRTVLSMLPLLKSSVLRLSEDSIAYNPIWNILKRTRRSKTKTGSDSKKFPEMPLDYYYNKRLSNRKISAISKRLLETYDYSSVKSKKQRNFLEYLELFKDINTIQPLYNELPSGVCPLHFPVIVRNRNYICKRLNDLSIDAISWWAGYHSGFAWDKYPETCYLKDKVLVLPIHHLLEKKHINFIAEKLVEIVSG